jgi:hypothetical protein
MVVKIGNLERRKIKDWIHDKPGMREQRTLEIGTYILTLLFKTL